MISGYITLEPYNHTHNFVVLLLIRYPRPWMEQDKHSFF